MPGEQPAKAQPAGSAHAGGGGGEGRLEARADQGVSEHPLRGQQALLVACPGPDWALIVNPAVL